MPNANYNREAQLYSGFTKAVAKAGSPERQAERSAARLRKEQLDQELQRTRATKPTEADLSNLADTQSLEIQRLETEARAATNNAIKQSTFSSFERYDNDNSNVRHLNTLFKDLASTEAGKNLFGGVTRVDELTESDRQLIRSQGLPADFVLNDLAAKGIYVKATEADGTQTIRSVDRLKAATGYTDYASQAELDRQIRAKKLEQIAINGGGETEGERYAYTQAIAGGETPGTPEFATAVAAGLTTYQRGRRGYRGVASTEDERRANRMALLDGYKEGTSEYERAYLDHLDKITQRTSTTTGNERRANRTAINEGLKEGTTEYEKRYLELLDEYSQPRSTGSQNEREADRQTDAAIADGDTRPREEIFNEKFDEITTRKARTSKQKDREIAITSQDSLDELAKAAGGEDFFDDTLDLSNPRIRAKIEPHIAAIEDGLNAELSTDERSTLERINELTSLGDSSSELTADQTGLIDRVFRNVKKYISDNVEGIEQEAAYAAYRNVVRHAMFGSVLTSGETASFKEQFGALTQQVGPILAQLKSSLGQVKSNYETLLATNNPYVMKYRTGKTAREIEDVIDAIDQRLELFDGFKSSSTIQPEQKPGGTPPPMSPERKAKLAEIMGGTSK